MRENTHKAKGSKGFTFTLSIVLISITLLAMAAFSKDWRAGQQESFTEILPSEALFTDQRVSSDLAKMLGASALVEKENGTTASLDLSVQMPFKKEGASLADMAGYAESLSSTLRTAGFEAVLSASGINGSNATVMSLFGTGTLVQSNGGPYDTAAYYHPTGTSPSEVYVTISCNRTGGDVGTLSVAGANQTGGYYFHLNYTESGGRQYLADCISPPESNTTLSIIHSDLSQIFFESSFSQNNSRNRTSLHYTKSPSGFLILPFDENGTPIDYSIFENNLSLGDGAASPTWASSCKSGGCYEFDGVDDYISGANLIVFESELPPLLGIERVSNGTFENFTGIADDGITDSWPAWSITNPDPAAVFFDATNDSVTGYAVKIINLGGAAGDNHISQAISDLWENTAYTLSFQSKGLGGGFRIVDATNASAEKYLQAGGTWDAASADLPTNANSSSYRNVAKQFSLAMNSSVVRIEFLPNGTTGNVSYDSITMKQSAGQNSGFESYYNDTGPAGTGFVPEED